MEEQEIKENQIEDEELEKYIKNLRFLANPFFCELCCVIRGVKCGHKTYLNSFETMLYRTRGVCSFCHKYLNEHSGEENLEKRLTIFEKLIGYKPEVKN